MPLTEFQEYLVLLLSKNRSEDSYLAGGAAIHIEPQTIRFSNDLDYFHDSVERVATSFETDRLLLEHNQLNVEVEMNQPGYIRANVSRDELSTKIEWAHDSAWRFMPTVLHPKAGFVLHPIDLAINKVLALVGRDEPRDFLDVLELDRTVLSLGVLVWAAAGKDPGFTPFSLLELLKRRGKYHASDFNRLLLREKVNLVELKTRWLEALANAEAFLHSRNPGELGCLYYSISQQTFMTPREQTSQDNGDIVCHYGRPGGVLPRVID